MKPGFVCVAGVDTERMVHMRPVFRRGQLRRWLVDEQGAPFNMACLADLGNVFYRSKPPAVEDVVFRRSRARRLGDVPAGHFWKLLSGMCRSSLIDIFGHSLKPYRETYAVEKGGGAASLGCLTPRTVKGPSIESFERDGKRKSRVSLFVSDGLLECTLPVTDLRLYEADQRTPRGQVVEQVRRRIGSGVRIILSVGLTRPMHGEKHWLQVNNIHLEDDPTWQVDVRPACWLRRALRRMA